MEIVKEWRRLGRHHSHHLKELSCSPETQSFTSPCFKHTQTTRYDTSRSHTPPGEKALSETALKVKVTSFICVCSKQVWGRLIGQGYYPEEHSSDWSLRARSGVRSEDVLSGRSPIILLLIAGGEKNRTVRVHSLLEPSDQRPHYASPMERRSFDCSLFIDTERGFLKMTVYSKTAL